MAEYIKREAAVALIEEKQKELCPVGRWSRHEVYGTDREKFDAWQEIIDALNSIPTVDAVVVTRCKDCKWFADNNGGEWYGCKMFQVVLVTPEDAPKPDDFCSYGEPREDVYADDHD